METQLSALTKQKKRYTAELDDMFQIYDKAKEQAAALDYNALMSTRFELRPSQKQSAISHQQLAYGEKYQPVIRAESGHDVASVIDDKERKQALKLLHQKQIEQAHGKQKQHRKVNGKNTKQISFICIEVTIQTRYNEVKKLRFGGDLLCQFVSSPNSVYESRD